VRIAPVSGTITSIDLNVGTDVGTSAVVTLSNMNQPYTLDVYLDETDWDKAKMGYTATVTFDLLPDENYSGKITQVYPMLDDSSGTSMVHILVQLDDQIQVDLPVGSTASVDVTGGEALNAVLVSVSALKEAGSGKYIVYLMKNGKPVEQPVEIGLQDILNAEVKSGLEKGDVVLTDASTLAQ
jgi:HlyD family secretion protein